MRLLNWNCGASRLVFLIGNVAIKVPCVRQQSVLTRWGRIQQGRSCNLAERTAWLEGKFQNLCPIVWADRFGWIVVMKRAAPISAADFDEWFHSEDWPHVPFESVPYELSEKDAGRLAGGRLVMIDYGMRGYQVELNPASDERA